MFKWIAFIVFMMLLGLHIQHVMRYTPCRSNTDHRIYHVIANASDKQEAANRLSFLVNRMQGFVIDLDKRQCHFPKYAKMIQRLVCRYPPKRVKEGVDGCHFIKNKQEELVICVRDTETQCFTPLHKLREVMIHELAHIASRGTGHDKEFHINNKFLLKQSNHFFLPKH